MPPKKGSKINKALTCSECGKQYARPMNMANHMAKLHPSVNVNGTVPVVREKLSRFKAAEGFLLLEDNEGNLWLAERLR